ncbi:MAG: hypothetical protein DMF25_01200 [Verrucomicrobia bacterium]|nr:MAG: hypothetical protein DMF25_01200 [Verrucomicrobiota bacterium]
MLRVIPEFGSDDRRKNPRVVRFDHWGAAKSGLQLGEINGLLCSLPAAAGGAHWRVDRFHLHLFTAFFVPVQDDGAVSVINASGADRKDPIFICNRP